jgi:predicted metal-dependent phosphoesterase TrpH
MRFSETLKWATDEGLITIAEHPYVESHRGMGKELLEKYIGEFSAIEGHNSQAIFSNWITKLPKIGKVFSRAGRELNERAKQTARDFDIPYVATSDAHRIEDLGLSYIEWVGKIDDSSEEKFIEYLRLSVEHGDFRTKENYENIFDWFNWVRIFQKGIKSGEVKNEYICSKELKRKNATSSNTHSGSDFNRGSL